jgi:hypothetical protein
MEELKIGSAANRSISGKLNDFHGTCEERMGQYFGEDFYGADIYRVAEFLDGRVAFSVDSVEEIQQIKAIMKQSAFAAELIAPVESIPDAVDEVKDPFGAFLSDQLPKPAKQSGRSQVAKPSPVSTLCAFDKDFNAYVLHLRSIGEKAMLDVDPLEYWALHGGQFPIIARIAATVLAIPATSADVERLFSITGRILTKYRARLSADRVDMMTCLHGWLREEYEEEYGKGRRAKSREKRAKVNARFASISAGLEIIPGDDSAEDNDDESDEEDSST